MIVRCLQDLPLLPDDETSSAFDDVKLELSDDDSHLLSKLNDLLR